ncbi:MAG: DUF1835 domain-containing protein [Bacteroidota bacterium]
MTKKVHILNGDSALEIFKKTEIEGETIVFREMLCQGQCKEPILSEKFWEERQDFFKVHYNVSKEEYQADAQNEILRINDFLEEDVEICLWFEYDLFCHVNMFSIISYLDQKGKKENVYLICSGKNFGSEELKGLGEISTDDFMRLYDEKKLLSKIDFEFANYFWMIYQSDKHEELYSFTFQRHPTFQYMKDCMIAHFYRYPDKKTGLSYSQNIVLSMIDEGPKSREEIITELLRTQGYYGFGDLQYQKMIQDLSPLYEDKDGVLFINENGKAVFKGEQNLSAFVTVEFMVGGTQFTTFFFENERIYRLKA